MSLTNKPGMYYTYLTTHPGKTVRYSGMTTHLAQRILEHYLHRGSRKTFIKGEVPWLKYTSKRSFTAFRMTRRGRFFTPNANLLPLTYSFKFRSDN